MSGKSYIYKYLEFLIPVYNLVKTKNMAQVDIIRNGIIDKLLAISDQDYLLALQRLIHNSAVEENKITLTIITIGIIIIYLLGFRSSFIQY